MAEFVAKREQQQPNNESTEKTAELAALPGFGTLLSTFGYALNAESKKIEQIGGGTTFSAKTSASAGEQQNEGKNESLPPFAKAYSELEMKLSGQLDGPDPVELVEHREVRIQG